MMNTMKNAFISMTMLALAGCTQLMPYRYMQQEDPRLELDSSNSPAEVIGCIMPRWIGTSAGTHVIPDNGSQVIVVPFGSGMSDQMVASLVITPSERGSHLVYRDLSPSQTTGFAVRSMAVRACQK